MSQFEPWNSTVGKGRKPSEHLTPRELDFLRALDGLQSAGRVGTLSELSAWLGVTGSSACFLRDHAIGKGAVKSTGYGSTRRLSLTDMGREAIA